MNKISVPLQIVTPTSKRFGNIRNSQFFTLDVNGRSISPQNQEEHLDVINMNKTVGTDYESKKFKIRSSSNSVKTTRNSNYFPYQRIKNVDKIIQEQKQKQKQSIFQNVVNFPAGMQFLSQSNSPKNSDLGLQQLNTKQFLSRKQNQRLKQIQQIIKKEKKQFKNQHIQKSNIIKFESKLKNLTSNEIVKLKQWQLKQVIDRQNEKEKFFIFRINRNSLYSDIVRNRRKLSERRQIKKKCNDYSLLGRINYLNQYQETNFVLKNSLPVHKQKDLF